jgi:hypothetical protein
MDVISDSPAIGLPETQPMGVELYFSNQLMPLADKLHDNLKPVGRGDAILDFTGGDCSQYESVQVDQTDPCA